LENPEDDIDNSRVSFGNIVRFEFKDKRIHAQFAVGAIRKSYAAPDYIGEINSEVEFSKGKFTLNKLSFQS
jgi:Cys-tRNA synthase (O-phospho-L-seryl-tRNA:Cys-tRNA synthase)